MGNITRAKAADFEFDFADRLRRAMRVSGVGVGELADRLEVSRNAVSAWVNGRNMPRPRDIRGAAELTGFPVEWLITGKAPAEDGGSLIARPEGFEPPTFWSVVAAGMGLADEMDSALEDLAL